MFLLSDLVSIRKSSEKSRTERKKTATITITAHIHTRYTTNFSSKEGKSAPSTTTFCTVFQRAHVFAVILRRGYIFSRCVYFSYFSLSFLLALFRYTKSISIFFFHKISCNDSEKLWYFDPLCCCFSCAWVLGVLEILLFFILFYIATACAWAHFHVSYIIFHACGISN